MARQNLTPARVTAAAADLADEVGLQELTLSTLARRLGVALPSLYTHVRSLQDLRVRVSTLATAEMADQIADAIAGRSHRDALSAFANAFRDFARAHPGRYAATQRQLTADDLSASDGHARVVRMVYQVFRAYDLVEPDLTDAVRFVRSLVHGFVALEASGGFQDPRAIEQSWHRAVDALHTTLVAWPTAAGTSEAAPGT
jgi:AcrR family transcriptional regulator